MPGNEQQSERTGQDADEGDLFSEVATAYREAMESHPFEPPEVVKHINQHLLVHFAASRAGMPVPSYLIPSWAEPLAALDIGFEGTVDADTLGDATELVIADLGVQKQTGSYYTPEFAVDHIITHTVEQQLRETIEPYARVETDNIHNLAASVPAADQDTVLAALDELRILDPAMGSGHFLVAALDAVAEVREAIAPDRRMFHHVRRTAENNIYGVDLKEIAVEMAKLRIRLRILDAIPATESGLPNQAVFE